MKQVIKAIDNRAKKRLDNFRCSKCSCLFIIHNFYYSYKKNSYCTPNEQEIKCPDCNINLTKIV